MIQLPLEQNEKEILSEVLEKKLSDLSFEIADTDQYDFKQELKERRVLLMKILEKLKES